MFVREIELEIDGKEKIIQLDQKYEGDTGIGRYSALEVSYIGLNPGLLKWSDFSAEV